MKNEFLSKGKTLEHLKKLDISFKIPNSYIFTVNEWRKNKQKILKYIKKKFKKKLAIRSSALDEDTITSSSAGKYSSFLNVDNNFKDLSKFINSVIKDYKKKKNYDINNEILVQNMLKNVKASGVLFTKNISNGAPYYIINYDDLSGKTDTVTSGIDKYSNRVLKVLNNKEFYLKSKRFKKLVNATKELEEIFDYKNLDIEFTIDKKFEIFLLQVRPLIKVPEMKEKIIFLKEVEKLKKKIAKKIGKKNKETVFGQMPDWNPAEMIGKNPKKLSYSLYSTLITDKCWNTARKQMGYTKIKNSKLMTSFSGKPYIDARKSFNSLLPEDLSIKLKNKLINASLEILKNNPEYHDKIEFLCSVNAFSLNTRKKIKEIYKNNLTKKEEDILFSSLRKITKINSDITQGSIFSKSISKVLKLKDKQLEYNTNNINDLKLIIKDLKLLGIVPFSILARNAFISQNIINSLEEKKIFSKREKNLYQSSIETYASELIKDSNNLIKNKISFRIFKKKYGHLRPGTYNIESLNYNSMDISNFKKSLTTNVKNNTKFKYSKKILKKYEYVSKKNYFPIEKFEDLDNYIRQSIYWREYSKFIFTKSVNLILEKIKKFGKKNKLSLNNLSHLDVKYLLNLKKQKLDKIEKNKILELIKKNERKFLLNNMIELPVLLKSKHEAYVIPSHISKANFITNKKVSGKILALGTIKNEKKTDLKNKIILIEGADPGYDWIFLHGIKGLITKYGGANSHMSIRCSELGITAAIGCGIEKFNELKNFNYVEIDAMSKFIKGVL